MLQAPEDDSRVIWTYGDKLRLKPLPVLVAANGHVYFYQHLPEKCGSSCIVSPPVPADTMAAIDSEDILKGQHSAKTYLQTMSNTAS